MKSLHISLIVTGLLALGNVCPAAPVESTESSRVVALQKVDSFLSEQVVAAQMESLGMTKAEVTARLATLSDTELATLAGQIDLLQAGGTIQGGNPHPSGVLGCIFKPVGRFFYNLYQLIFCWGHFNID